MAGQNEGDLLAISVMEMKSRWNKSPATSLQLGLVETILCRQRMDEDKGGLSHRRLSLLCPLFVPCGATKLPSLSTLFSVVASGNKDTEVPVVRSILVRCIRLCLEVKVGCGCWSESALA